MTNYDSDTPKIWEQIELIDHFEATRAKIESLGLVLDMDISDVNPFESSYAYTTIRENDEAKLYVIRYEHVEFHEAPITIHQYLLRLVGKSTDDRGLRIVEEIELVHDEVPDESKLSVQDKTIESDGFVVTISGDFQPQQDRIKHRKTLGEFNEDGGFIFKEPTDSDTNTEDLSQSNTPRSIFEEQEKLDDPHKVLGRAEEILARFSVDSN